LRIRHLNLTDPGGTRVEFMEVPMERYESS
jgi:hypothetical protein